MAQTNFKITFKGMDDLSKDLKLSEKKQFEAGFGLAVLQIHNALAHSIFTRYNSPNDLNTVLVGKTTSQVKRGKNFLKSGLEYKYVPIPLARFPNYSEPGNINPGASKPGPVNYVSVRRDGYKVVYGKLGFGGFHVKKSRGATGAQVYERQQEETWWGPGIRAPISALFGPSLAERAAWAYDSDPEVTKVLNTFEELMLKDFMK